MEWISPSKTCKPFQIPNSFLTYCYKSIATKNYDFLTCIFVKKKRFFLPTKTVCRIPYQVNSRHVVTAGHCVAVPLSDPSRSGLATTANASSVRVLLGEYSVRRSTEPLPEEEFRVTMVRLHPHYRGRAQVRYF